MIREMRWWDIAAVAEIEPVLYPHNPWSTESFWGELAAGGQYFVATQDEVIVGYSGLTVSLDEGNVQTVAVAPDWQGHGIGAALLERLLAVDGLHRVDLEVASRNLAARKLYESRGFVEVGRRNGYYAAEKDDAILMSVTL